MRYLIVLPLFLTGCIEPRLYRVNGERIKCKDFFVNHCGVYLDRCDNGIVYSCQSNVADVTDEVIVLEERKITPRGDI